MTILLQQWKIRSDFDGKFWCFVIVWRKSWRQSLWRRRQNSYSRGRVRPQTVVTTTRDDYRKIQFQLGRRRLWWEKKKKNMCAISFRSDFIEGKRGAFADSSLTVPVGEDHQRDHGRDFPKVNGENARRRSDSLSWAQDDGIPGASGDFNSTSPVSSRMLARPRPPRTRNKKPTGGSLPRRTIWAAGSPLH